MSDIPTVGQTEVTTPMSRVSVVIVLLLPLLSSCGERIDSPTTTQSAVESQPENNSDIQISFHIPDAERQTIVLNRVEQDIHGLASKYPDRDLRVLLEIIAGDSGVHPARIDVDNGLRNPPFSFDDLDVVELVMTIEDMFGVTISDEEFDRDLADPTANQLLRIVGDRKTK